MNLTHIVFTSVLLASSTAFSATPEVTSAALRKVEAMSATRMAPDRQGNLILWHQPQGRVTVISPQADILSTTSIPEAVALDADQEWGVAALTDRGATIRITPIGKGGKQLTVPIQESAFSIAWMDGDTVAVAPKLGSFRVEVWDVINGVRKQQLGPEQPIVRRAGQYRARGVHLAFDHHRQQLLSFDAFTGEMVVFARDGSIVRRAGVRHPDWARLSEQFDRPTTAASQAPSGAGSSEVVFCPWDSVALDSSGAAWLAETAGPHKVGFVVIPNAQGDVRRLSQDDLTCVSVRFTIWERWLITYRDPMMPMAPCVGTRRIE